MSRPLPDRPNLEQLKKQAKSLLHAAHAREAAALARFAILPAFSSKAGRRASTRRRSRCTTRSPSSRASTDSRRGMRCARRSRRARSPSTPPSTSSSARRRTARRAARCGCSRCIPASPRRRCTPRSSSPTRPRSRRVSPIARSSPHSRADRSSGSRCSTRVTPACTAIGRTTWCPSRGGCSRSARIPTPSTTGTGIRNCRARRCGQPSARSSTCRSPNCCSTPAPTRRTASRRTSPAVAAATSGRSSCCTASG